MFLLKRPLDISTSIATSTITSYFTDPAIDSNQEAFQLLTVQMKDQSIKLISKF
jgi:hypothetical protein